MKFIIQLPGADSEPLDEAQVTNLYVAGAIRDLSQAKTVGGEWQKLREVCPFLAGVRTTAEIIEESKSAFPATMGANIKAVEIGFLPAVKIMTIFIIASLPILFVLYLIDLLTSMLTGHPTP